MGRAKKNKEEPTKPAQSKRPIMPSSSPEGREKQLISLAVDLAEQQLREGTASSQVITHFLKLGATTAQYETEKIKLENELLKAKTEAIQSSKRIEELYNEALKAMRTYSGNINNEDV